MIVLRALGTAEIDTGVSTLTPSQEIVFAAALYLILERGKRVSRPRLAEMLWPEVPERARAHRLRQTIFQLKKSGIVVTADRDSLRLSQHEVRSDVDELATADASAVSTRDSLEFLPGYTPRLSEPLRDWVEAKRVAAHAAASRLLLHGLQAARLRADWLAVETISAQCLGLDNCNETAILARAEGAAMRGSKRDALMILDRYIAEIGPEVEIKLPPLLLRRRIAARIPDTRDPLASESNFVGRRRELGYLLERLRDSERGLGSACLVVGEAGIGKTRLFSELAKFAELDGVAVHRVVCRRSEANQPLASIIDLVQGLRELPGALGCEPETLACLKRFTELDPSAPRPEHAVDAGPYLRRAIPDLIDAVSDENRIAILVEDIQWMDSGSASLFATLVEQAGRRTLVCVFNCRGEDNPLTHIVGAASIQRLRLQGLPRDAASNLVENILHAPNGGQIAHDVDWLVETGDGNPFFLQELTKHWLETGKRHDVPPSVSSVLGDRVNGLTPLACHVLQTCAVLGADSNADRVGKVLECPSHDLLNAIQDLTISGMLRSATDSGHSAATLLTRHDLLSTAVLERLTPVSAAFLHRRCALVLEQELAGSTVSIPLLRSCAFHWSHAGEAQHAFSFAIKCANHFLDIGLAADAAAAFEGALLYCPSTESRLDLLGEIVRTQMLAREWSRALERIRETRTLRTGNGRCVQHDNLETLEFEALRRTASDLHGLFRRALCCVYDDSLPPTHRVEAAAHALKIGTSIADGVEMRRVFAAVRKLLNDPAIDPGARLQVNFVYNTMCGDLKAAVRQARQNVRIARAHGFPSHIIAALGDLSFVLRRVAAPEEAYSALLEAYEVAARSKLLRAVGDTAIRLADFAIQIDHEDASLWLDRAILATEGTADEHLHFSLQGYRARLAMRENRFEEAIAIMTRGVPSEWLRSRHNWYAAHLAITIRALVGGRTEALEVEQHVNELAELFEITSALGGQDYEVGSLCLGLKYLNRSVEAESYLSVYVTERRRELTPLPGELILPTMQVGSDLRRAVKPRPRYKSRAPRLEKIVRAESRL
ncbi:MAG: ATP-binding protein [Gemmatimonadaceae bacterium]